ncbi:hypothetical protein HPB50_003396 [Hyalomma asiaticum]|uniref:Uncharacterized protein n=1 Tax=Hyalomma asiaticum TaxID=266040 RepID=A0ACB7RSE4_HYAAI|nr:hypothetical protein HPB50_003396 [Hyalomma asiaticum]
MWSTTWWEIFLDKTWVTAGHTQSTIWMDTVVQQCGRWYTHANGLSMGLKQPSGKGQCLIITHISSEDGFVGGSLVSQGATFLDVLAMRDKISACSEPHV